MPTLLANHSSAGQLNAAALPIAPHASSGAVMKLRTKNQITLPREVVDTLALGDHGLMTYTLLQDGVLLRPLHTQLESRLHKIQRISTLHQTPGFALYSSAQAVDAAVREQREAWV